MQQIELFPLGDGEESRATYNSCWQGRPRATEPAIDPVRAQRQRISTISWKASRAGRQRCRRIDRRRPGNVRPTVRPGQDGS